MHREGISQDSQPHSVTEVRSNKRKRTSASTCSLICPDSIPSDGSSTLESGSQNPSSEPSASSTDVSNSQTGQNRFDRQIRFGAFDASQGRDVVDIPHSIGRKKLYLTVAVETPNCDTTVCNQKFLYFEGLLKKAINSHQDLRDQLRSEVEVSFNLYMVGKTLETARPSIVVFCFGKYLKRLQDIFRKCLQEQVNIDPRFSIILPFLRNQQPNDKFDLVYFCVDRPVDRRASEDTLTVHLETAATWCGGLARSESRTSTLGIAIYTPEFLGVLTVDHIFRPSITSSSTLDSQMEEDGPEASGTLGPHSDSSEQQNNLELWLEDTDEYDFDDITWQSDTAIVEGIKANTTEADSVNSPHDATGDVVRAKWQRLLPAAPLDDKASYLDWALVRPMLNFGTHCLPNMFYPDGLDNRPVALAGVFGESPAHWAKVFMVSGVRGILKGHILASYSVLGPTPSCEDCETWTVILDSVPGIVDVLLEGECGSLIIDQKSNEIYGHAVACGPLGQVYVSPMKYVLSQIKMSFGIKEVHLIQHHRNITDEASGKTKQKLGDHNVDKQTWSSMPERAIKDRRKVKAQIQEALEEARDPSNSITTLSDFLRFVKDIHVASGLFEKYESIIVDMWYEGRNSCPPATDGSSTCDKLNSKDSDNLDDEPDDLPSLEEGAEIGSVWIKLPLAAAFHEVAYKPRSLPGSYIRADLMQMSGFKARKDGIVVIQWDASEPLGTGKSSDDTAEMHTACRIINKEQAESIGMNVSLVLGTDCTKELQHQEFGIYSVRRAARRVAHITKKDDPQAPISPEGSPSLEQQPWVAHSEHPFQPVTSSIQKPEMLQTQSLTPFQKPDQGPRKGHWAAATQHDATTVHGPIIAPPRIHKRRLRRNSDDFQNKRKMDDEHESRPKDVI